MAGIDELAHDKLTLIMCVQSFHFPKTSSTNMDASMLAKRARSMQAVANAGWESINSGSKGKAKKKRRRQDHPLSKEERTMVSIERMYRDTRALPLMTNNERHSRYPTSAPRDYTAYLYALEPWQGADKRLAWTPGKATLERTKGRTATRPQTHQEASNEPVSNIPEELPPQYRGDAMSVARRIMRVADRNRNAELSYTELTQMLHGSHYQDFGEWVEAGKQQFFRTIDIDQQGTLSLEELTQVVKYFLHKMASPSAPPGGPEKTEKKARQVGESAEVLEAQAARGGVAGQVDWNQPANRVVAGLMKDLGVKDVEELEALAHRSRRPRSVLPTSKARSNVSHPSIQVRNSDIPVYKRDMEYGHMFKGEADQGRKFMRTFVMRLNQRRIPQTEGLYGVRSDLVRATLKRHGVKIDSTLVLRSKKVFLGVCRWGSADRNQFDSVMQKLGVKDVFANDRIFQMFDVDLSGYVDTNEFVLGMAAACDATLVEKLTSYFDMVDVDNSGSLSQEERAPPSPPSLSADTHVTLIWQEIEDMLVSSHAFNDFSQIRANVVKVMDMLDPDGSNSITLAEFQACVML